MNVYAIYDNKRLSVKAGLGALRFRVFPPKTKKKPVKERKPSKPVQKKNFPMPETEFIFETLDKLRKSLVVRDLDIGYMPPGGDPMAAAMINALINEAAAALLPTLNNLFKVKKSRVVVSPNFSMPNDRLYVKLHVSLSVYSALTIGLSAFLKYNKFRKTADTAKTYQTENKSATESTYERKEI
ncbi:MAG: DUF2953 domain-containing protein [Oscillospiraceae bacterium]|jgi:hypothetical protein|nr:DUF2953 domain-containing protein [Oscillospiraceae bacterium]